MNKVKVYCWYNGNIWLAKIANTQYSPVKGRTPEIALYTLRYNYKREIEGNKLEVVYHSPNW